MSVAPFPNDPGLPQGALNLKAFGAHGDGASNDTAAINAWLTALATPIIPYLSSTGYAPAGNYSTAGGHIIPPNVTLVGDGYGTIGAGNGATVFSLRNNSNTDVFSIAGKTVVIRDLGIYGNKANQTAQSRCLTTSLTVSSNYFRLQRVWLDSAFSDGFYLQGPGTSLEGQADACKFTNHGANGLNASAGSAADCQFANCIFNSNTTNGASVNAGDIVFTACHFWGNTGAGFQMPSGAAGYARLLNCYLESNTTFGAQPRGNGNQFVGCYFYNNGSTGCYAFSNTGSTFSGNVFRANNRTGAAGAVGAGLELDTCTNCATTGNNFYDDGGTKKQTYGYAENANTCNGCSFTSNVSPAAQHLTGNWLIGAGTTPTIPATPASYNVG